MMSDDADDVDADGADDNVGDNDGVFFSLALAQANGLAQNNTRPRGHRQRPAGPPPGMYTRPRLHHGFHGSAHLPVSWWCRRLAFLISIASGVLDSLCRFLATKIGCRRYKVYRKWQEHNWHP